MDDNALQREEEIKAICDVRIKHIQEVYDKSINEMRDEFRKKLDILLDEAFREKRNATILHSVNVNLMAANSDVKSLYVDAIRKYESIKSEQDWVKRRFKLLKAQQTKFNIQKRAFNKKVKERGNENSN